MMISIWTSAAKAKQLGCTHHARFMGIIPGFFGIDTDVWVSRSDLLNPLESLLVFIWVSMRQMRGEEPDFMFEIMGEIE